MKRYITYFDFLGYKSFILNNNNDYLRRRINNILAGAEMALGRGKTIRPDNGFVYADLSESKINYLNISDTIIFWTNSDTVEEFKELLEVSHRFNWWGICYDFPVRGAMIYGEIEIKTGFNQNDIGGSINVNSIYGKGLVYAHLKAESQNWAGTVIDNSVISKIENQIVDFDQYITRFTKLYKIPYKGGNEAKPEYALRLVTDQLNEEAFKNRKDGIEKAFFDDNKDDNIRVREILENTIKFLKTELFE